MNTSLTSGYSNRTNFMIPTKRTKIHMFHSAVLPKVIPGGMPLSTAGKCVHCECAPSNEIGDSTSTGNRFWMKPRNDLKSN